MSKTTLVLIVGFIAGCGAAALAPLVIPPAHAQSVQRWEMYCAQARRMEGAGGVIEIANRAGREGWEPLQVEGVYVCFKRPAP